MNTRFVRASAMLLIAVSTLVNVSASMAAAKETVRPAVGKPLQAAQKLMQGKKFKEALDEIGHAEAVGRLTPYESFIIEQMRGSAAASAGDYDMAAGAFEKVLAANRLAPEEKLQLSESVISIYYKQKNYAKVSEMISRYRATGGKNPQILGLAAQAYYLKGDFVNAGKEAASMIAAAESAGQKPTEDQIKLFASSAIKQNNMVLYTGALEKLVTYYPKPDNWADLIQRTALKPGFSDKLALDMYRLLRVTNTLKDAKDYMEMAQLAVQAQVPGEAQSILDEGYAKKILGTGSEAERHSRLKKLVETKIADDKKTIGDTESQANAAAAGDPLVNIGMAYVTYGDTAKGLPMITAGIKKNHLKAPDQANLHLGYAYYIAGQKDKALQTFKTVSGKDGSADLARLWSIVAGKP